MKYFSIILLILATFASCDSSKTVVKESDVAAVSNDTIRIANKSLEYEILIIEPGFESWLVTQKPEGFYGQTYLEGKNRLFVSEYNRRVQNFQLYDRLLYEQEINYEFHLDYGYEVNYLLYNYFLYFQETYNQSFIGGRSSIR
ncbi:MAG: hypothetical protein E2O83_06565 [Bacteroidetes bacterium]|nr:MAG: hypothetical protein E2O83_06565 [Bacteroidota bacterium]